MHPQHQNSWRAIASSARWVATASCSRPNLVFNSTEPSDGVAHGVTRPTSGCHGPPGLVYNCFACGSLTLQIINGPAYVLALNGSGYKPKLNLSFLSCDFGPCHVFQQGMTPAVAKLIIVNEDRQPVSFDAVFDNTDTWQVGGWVGWWLGSTVLRTH